MKFLLKELLSKVLKEYDKYSSYVDDIEIINNSSKDVEKFGDYSTNFPLKIGKKINEKPIEIAQEISSILENYLEFSKVEIQTPGFINLFLDKDFVFSEFKKFANSEYKPKFENVKPQRINYEYVSANPTGWLHLGHARNAFVGDVTTNLLSYLGHKVYLEYYINDFGVQIDNLAKSIQYFYQLDFNHKTIIDEPLYRGFEIEAYAKQFTSTHGDKYLENNSDNYQFIKKSSLEHFLNEIKKTLEKLKIKAFDEYVSEAELYETKKVNDALKILESKNAIFEEDGARWIRSTAYGDDKDRVLLKEDGTFTYLMADIANHVSKINKGFDKLIDLWGKDHHGYEARVKAAISFMGYEANYLEVDYINMVQISNEGKAIKMSKRAGTSITINAILEEVPADILRFFMISKSKDQGLEIDISQALTESTSNPFYYLQYANARANQIIEKYEMNNKIDENIKVIEKINSKTEFDLMKKVLEFEEYVLNTTKQREPSILINYAKELAASFHSFYNSDHVITEDKTLTKERIFITLTFKRVMKRVFDLLGIEPMDKM